MNASLYKSSDAYMAVGGLLSLEDNNEFGDTYS